MKLTNTRILKNWLKMVYLNTWHSIPLTIERTKLKAATIALNNTIVTKMLNCDLP